ncbi:MAG: type III-B CRISPR module RAMP protein Cmr1 [Pseudomonadota bacterium]|nr:type III-B CRISPR module RAMP protein Cmr1 [Pseudomonadota bacterium]
MKKIQAPSADLLDAARTKIDQRETGWQRYCCTLVTPLFGGGVKPGEVDGEMPIRASAIRGQLRFWWRLLNRGHHPGGDGTSASQALYLAEREIWGGLGDQDTLAASKVALRVELPPTRHFLESKQQMQADAVRYAFGAAANNGEARWLKDGYEWTLWIRHPDSLKTEIAETLRWWASFGGLGARTRRGFGAIAVDDWAGDERKPLSPITREEAKLAGMRLILQKNQLNSAITAWQVAVDRLRDFRQGPEVGRKAKREGNTDGRSPGRSYWPEPDAIRGVANQWFGKSGDQPHQIKNKRGEYEDVGVAHNHKPEHPAGNVFPRAAFGLPLIFHFKDRGDPNPDYQLIPDNGSDRMASPLILRPYRVNDGWKAAALCMPMKHVWSMGVRFKDRNEHYASGEWWPLQEDERKAVAKLIPPMRNTGYSDPLTAFLKFFNTEDAA